jgi:SAM-dependent methyltransferase
MSASKFEIGSGSVVHDDFYRGTLLWLLKKGIFARETRILVICGGAADREVLCDLGFSNVTISNLDVRLKGDEFAPYEWSFQDAENLTYRDEEFDFCIAHNGLHHCHSPHRGLLEMYRVAKSGVLIFEPRDTLVARAGVRLNFGQDYEVAAIADNALRFGGVRNTFMPNYVYRWTEREIEKTVASFAPWGKHRFIFRYALRIPWRRLNIMKNKIFLFAVQMLLPILRIFFALFPKQSNCFAFVILKPRIPIDLHPWLRSENTDIVLNEEYIHRRYGVQK